MIRQNVDFALETLGSHSVVREGACGGRQRTSLRSSIGVAESLCQPASGATDIWGRAQGEAAPLYFCSWRPVRQALGARYVPGFPLATSAAAGARCGEPREASRAEDVLRDLGGWEREGRWLLASWLVLGGGLHADEAVLVHTCLNTWCGPARKRKNGRIVLISDVSCLFSFLPSADTRA